MAVDSVSICVGLALCAGLGWLAWRLDPHGRKSSSPQELEAQALAQRHGLLYRGPHMPLGPGLYGSIGPIEVEILLKRPSGEPHRPQARLVVGSASSTLEAVWTLAGGLEEPLGPEAQRLSETLQTLGERLTLERLTLRRGALGVWWFDEQGAEVEVGRVSETLPELLEVARNLYRDDAFR